MATHVTNELRSTVFFRPIRPISNPVGNEQTANHRKTIIGNRFASVSLKVKSFFT